MHSLTVLDGPTDAELIASVRGGDLDGYDALFVRHVGAARRLAGQLVSASQIDDLVSDAFFRVLATLRRGGGPDVAFRAYLLTSLRRLHIDRIRATNRVVVTSDLTEHISAAPFTDTVVAGFESRAAAEAFASLPERWQLVLWHTEVEGQKPADIAPLLGLTPGSVASLAYRAREGLRQAFVTLHARDTDDADCAQTRRQLGAFLRNGSSRRERARVEGHLDGCRPCLAVCLELSEVNADLRAVLAPLFLGGSAAAYLAATAGGLAQIGTGGLAQLAVERGRDLLVSHASSSAVAGATAAAIVTGGVVAGMQHPDPAPQAGDRSVLSREWSAADRLAPAPASAAAGATDEASAAPAADPGAPDAAPGPRTGTLLAVVDTRPGTPGSTPSSTGPGDGAGNGPGARPGGGPTSGPGGGPSSGPDVLVDPDDLGPRDGPTKDPTTKPPTVPPTVPPTIPPTTPPTVTPPTTPTVTTPTTPTTPAVVPPTIPTTTTTTTAVRPPTTGSLIRPLLTPAIAKPMPTTPAARPADTTVTSSTRPLTTHTATVTVTLDGLPAERSSTVRLRPPSGTVPVSLSPGCVVGLDATVTCRVDGAGAAYSFFVLADDLSDLGFELVSVEVDPLPES